MKIYRTRFRGGFTIIELITVIAIIVLLASLVMTAGQAARRKAMEAKARSAIASLEVALSMYQLDVGDYPATGNANLITQLDSGGATPPTGWKGPYMQFETKEIVGGQFIDSWGSAYKYTKPGINHGTGANHSNYVDIYSYGQNKVDNSGAYNPPTQDDIANW